MTLKNNCIGMMAIFIISFFPTFCQAGTDSAEADFQPWSGYWWPKTEGGLATGISYRGHPAPIEKYELLKNGYYPGLAAQFELDNYYDPEALSWFGQCASWAAASVYEHIVFYPSSIENIIFYVGDKKGLITACHQNDVEVRANSHPPEVFHWWLLHYIKDNRVDFYANLDPSGQVWNYPVFKYAMETSENGDRINVTCRIWYVDDFVDPDVQEASVQTKTYTYILYKRGSEITGGEWTGASIHDHPQQLNLPVSPNTDNPYLDYQYIRNIAVSRDDELESQEPVALSPGGYNLILLDSDIYTIACETGDGILLSIRQIDTIQEKIRITVWDAMGSVAFDNEIDGSRALHFKAEKPPYKVQLGRNDYASGGVYRLDFDLIKAFEIVIPKIQRGFGWGGFAITNPSETACENVYLVGYNQTGGPIETYVGPFTLAPHEKRIVLTSEIDVRNIEANDLYSFKVMAPAELKVVYLSGYFQRNMSCFQDGDAYVMPVIIPDITTWANWSKSVSWGIYNGSIRNEEIHMALFSKEGVAVEEVTVSFPANGLKHYNASVAPFRGLTEEGWVAVKSQSGLPVRGYIEWLQNGINSAETLFPLIPGDRFFLPHLALDQFWNSFLVLINAEADMTPVRLSLLAADTTHETIVTLTPKQKKRFEIRDLFPQVSESTVNSASLEIKSTGMVAGFFGYESPFDDVYYPLLQPEDINTSLVLPHSASTGYWWTALCLFNPSVNHQLLRYSPFDSRGQLMAEAVNERLVGPFKKDIFTISSMFGSSAPQISFIKIDVVDGDGVVGFFGMGDSDCRMLSGGILR